MPWGYFTGAEHKRRQQFSTFVALCSRNIERDKLVMHFDVGRLAEGGAYETKGDYLGYQFWSSVETVPQTLLDIFTIPHQEVAATVDGFYLTQEPVQGVKVYLFTASGAYVGISGTTDASGQVHFSLPDRQYKVRVDYLGNQFWSDVFQSQDIAVTINEGLARVHVHRSGVDQQGLKVYLFSSGGSYLSRSQTTDASGEVEFVLPDRSFKFRVDQAGKQYWSGVVNIIAGEENPVDLDLDQLALIKTNNPKPARFDGVPPVREREEKRIAGLEGLVGIISRTAVGYTSTPKVYYYLNDQLGTPQLMVDSTGTVVWEARYKPFGEAQVHSSSTVVNNFRFPGQYYDSDTGLHYNYFRDYHPGIGRYVEPDPIGLEGGTNLYAYVHNDPIDSIDPMGLKLIWIPIPVPVPIPIPTPAGPVPIIVPIPVPIPIPVPDEKPISRDFPDEDKPCDKVEREKKCDNIYYNIDIPTCRAISKRYGKAAGERCYASAADRYAACLAGKPMPPLDTWRN